MKFKKKNQGKPLDMVPPSGIFLRTPDRKVFYSKAGRLYEVSEIHLGSWSAEPISTTSMAVSGLPVVGKLGFRDGTIVKDFVSGRIYLISDSRKRLITSPDALEQLGGTERVITVPTSYIELHKDGEDIGNK